MAAQEGGATKSSGAEAASNKMVASFLALQLFCEVCPELGVEHIPTLVRRGYLKSSTKGTKQQIKNSFYVVDYTAKILAGTIPLSKKLSPEMLKDLETTLIQLVITATALSVVEAAIKCLSCCVEQTKNMPLVTQTLQKFYNYLKNEHAALLMAMQQCTPEGARCPVDGHAPVHTRDTARRCIVILGTASLSASLSGDTIVGSKQQDCTGWASATCQHSPKQMLA